MKMKKNKLTGLLIGLVVVLMMIAGGLFYYKINSEPIRHTEHKIVFTVNEGDSSDTVLANLQEQFLIKNEFVTKLIMKLEGLSNFYAGRYELDQSWTPQMILQTLNDPSNALSDDVLISLPEGLWAKDIAKIIGESELNVNEEDLLAYWSDEALLSQLIDEYEFLTEDILNPELRVPLEGFLFPETYYFKKDATLEDVTRTLLNQFDLHYQELKPLFQKSDKTITQVMTLASMVQFEGKTAGDMRTIAGVFQNRIDQHYRLQSSVTVCYALYEYDSWLDCEMNADIDSPFNTYVIDGYPIGPIDNPGLDAIKAVLEPEQTDYMYFIADVYGDGTVYFASTYEEHCENIDKYLTR